MVTIQMYIIVTEGSYITVYTRTFTRISILGNDHEDWEDKVQNSSENCPIPILLDPMKMSHAPFIKYPRPIS